MWYHNNRKKISALCVMHSHYKSNTQLKGNRVSEKRIADLPPHADFVPCAFGRWEREVIGLVPTCESGFYLLCDGKAVIFLAYHTVCVKARSCASLFCARAHGACPSQITWSGQKLLCRSGLFLC